MADDAQARRPLYRARGVSDAALASHIPPASACSYPVRSGNHLRALVDGGVAFARICEAVDAARHSVWLTVAFLDPEFRMPDGRGLFDLLDGAEARGLDVRVIFWRTHLEGADHFHGHADDRAMLAERGARFLARWDRAQKHYCQHQKSWLIDAARPGEVAFVGGINLINSSVTLPGHANRDGRHTHDVYLELRGPSASDVQHNFVQRWNDASERDLEHGLWPDPKSHDLLPFPRAVSPAAGGSAVQMQRTIRAGQYHDGTAAPGTAPFAIAEGEFSVFEQYVKAIDAAKSAIYIEDQYIASPDIVERLHAALARGVDVVFLCPADPEEQVKAARKRPEAQTFWRRLAALGEYANFTLVGISSPRTGEAVYVHDKIMLVDDAWCTIGSCNIASQSFFCDTELNAAIWDATFTRALRAELFCEHLGMDTKGMDARGALKAFAEIARGSVPTANAFALDPASYGL